MKQSIRGHNFVNSVAILLSCIVGIIAIKSTYVNTGKVLLITSLYLLFYILFLKADKLRGYNKWLKHDSSIISGLVSLTCFFAIFESQDIVLILFFSELFVFLHVYRYLKFRNRNSIDNSQYILSKWGVLRFCFRMFFIAVTVLLIVSVANSNESINNVLDPYYFIVLAILLIEVLISHLNNTIRQKNEQSQAELMHLRSQLNPHFFFNTLNNLYALTRKNSKQAPEIIMKLSEMMRYTIYEGEKSKVSIKDEIIYLENYIELHKIRYRKNVLIEFNHSVDENDMISPLLFINLLENAFKHGVDTLMDNAFIKMDLTDDAHFIYFYIENNFDKKEGNQPKGIGITNLKRRLQLLYPKAHTFVLTQQKDIYKATLKISK